MSVRYRVFLVNDDDSLERVANSRWERLHGRRDPTERLPEHAGKRIRYALVVFERDDEITRIVHVDYGYVQLDAEGRHDENSHDEAMRDVMSLMDAATMSRGADVVGAKEMAQRRYRVKHRWEPSQAVERALVTAIVEDRPPPRSRTPPG